MIEFKRRLPATVANPETGNDVLFLDNNGVFYTKNAAGGLTVLGNGIVGIAKVGTVGLVDTYRITYDSGETFDYTVTNAKSITQITKIGTVGIVDTYRITFNDGPAFEYTVTNGLDGQGQPAQNNPTSIDPDDAASIGTRTAFYALEDHQHAIVAAPATGLTGDSTNTEGTAASFARSDHTHAISNGGTPTTIQPDATANQGASASLARSDHTHAIAADIAVGLNGGSTNGEGTSTSFARADHTHAIANGGTPSTITPDAAANQGASTSLARSDHTHAIAADVPVALGATAAEGTSGSFARADHVHVNPVIAHEAAADPHPQYTTTAEAAAAAPVQSVQVQRGLRNTITTGNNSLSLLLSETIYHVQDFGTLVSGPDTAAVGAAQATANRQAIQAAIDAAESTTGGKKPGGIVLLPPGTFHIDAQLEINTSGVVLMGAGAYGNSDIGTQTGFGTALFWNNTASPSTTAMIKVFSPVNASGAATKRAGVIGISLQCAGNVGKGLWVESVHFGRFENIYVINATFAGVHATCLTTGTQLGEAADNTKCVFEDISIRMIEAGASATGMILDGAANANTSNSTFRNIAMLCTGAQIALDLRNTDSNHFYSIIINQTNGATVQPVRLRGGTAAGLESRGNVFFYLAAGGSSTGTRGLYSEGTEIAGVTAPAKNNVIYGYSIENGEPYPIIGVGSTLLYEIAGGTQAFKIGAYLPALFTSTANSAAVQTFLTCVVPANYIQPGMIFEVEAYGTQSQSAAATNVVFQVQVNGTTIVTATVAGGTAAQTNRALSVQGAINFTGTGTTKTVYGGLSQVISGLAANIGANVAGVSINTAATVTITFQCQTSTANAANIIRVASACIKENNS